MLLHGDVARTPSGRRCHVDVTCTFDAVDGPVGEAWTRRRTVDPPVDPSRGGWPWFSDAMPDPSRPDTDTPPLRPPTLAERRWFARFARLLVGLVLCGVGIAAMVAADLGLGPWDVLHQGISQLTGIPIGTVGILVGLVVLLLWLPLPERPGSGTVANVIVIGLVIDAVLLVLDTPAAMGWRIALLVSGPVLFGIGSGFYIGARLGPGPRDGLMTGLARHHGWSVGPVRTGIELTVLALGWLLGGTAGIGTVLFALAIGPLVQFFLPRLEVADGLDDPRPTTDHDHPHHGLDATGAL